MKRNITMPELRGIECPRVEACYNISTAELLVAEIDEKGTSCLGV
jgi:hypothetical protein